MNHYLLLLASDAPVGQSWQTVQDLVRNGLGEALGAVIWAILFAIVSILGLHPRARAALSWIHARRWATVSAVAILLVLLLLIIAVAFGALPAAAQYVKLVVAWPFETFSLSLPRVGVLVLFVLAILKLWDWRARVFRPFTSILCQVRRWQQVARPTPRAERRDARHTSLEAVPPTQAEVAGLLATLAGEWDLTFGRGGSRKEACEIDADGRYFAFNTRRATRDIRSKFTLRVRSLDMASGRLRWEKVGPEGDVFHAEELKFEPGDEILLLDGHRVGTPEHIIRYRRT